MVENHVGHLAEQRVQVVGEAGTDRYPPECEDEPNLGRASPRSMTPRVLSSRGRWEHVDVPPVTLQRAVFIRAGAGQSVPRPDHFARRIGVKTRFLFEFADDGLGRALVSFNRSLHELRPRQRMIEDEQLGRRVVLSDDRSNRPAYQLHPLRLDLVESGSSRWANSPQPSSNVPPRPAPAAKRLAPLWALACLARRAKNASWRMASASVRPAWA